VRIRLPNGAFFLFVLAILLPAVSGRSGEDTLPELASAAPQTLQQLLAIEKRVQKVVEQVIPTVVGVRVGPAQGSGVIVSKDGYVLTAGHVISKPDRHATVTLADGTVVHGKTLGVYETLDAGLVKITDEGNWPIARQGQSGDVEPGTWCIAVGHPLGYQDGRPPVVRVGRVLRVDEDQIQTDCPLVAGDSGGPLFNLDGSVIGINSRIGGSTERNYHVPVAVFRESWDRLARSDCWADELPRKQCDEVTALLGGISMEAARCVVHVECQGRRVALGTVVDPAGWILTKASELSGPALCRLADGRSFDAQTVAVAEQFDLAILKITAAGLPHLPWSQSCEPAVGQWVAAPGVEGDGVLAVGVVSVPRRRIPPERGILGVGLAAADQGARVVRVLPGTPAERAGLAENDIITHLDGDPVHGQGELLDALGLRSPGDAVCLTVFRSGNELVVRAVLGTIDTPAGRKREMQNRSDIGISRRHDDFEAVLQHDAVLRPAECGGPLVDLTGQVIGINIARAGRTETYSLPADIVVPLVDGWISGSGTSAEPQMVGKSNAALETGFAVED
jgi:serine protease Do